MSSKVSKDLLINTLWSFIGRFGYLGVALASNIFLVRLLSPHEFGQVAIVMFFIIIGTVLVESGLSGALIRRDKVSELEYSTVFIFNLLIASIFLILLFFLSKYVAIFYSDPKIELILIISSMTILFTAFRITQNTKLIRNLKFKQKSFYEFLSISVGSLFAIYLALNNMGVWSLVASQLVTSATLTIILWFAVGPTKILGFNINAFKSLYKFGVNTTLASFLNTIFDNIYQLILGKYFNISQSGYFYQAKKLQDLPAGILESTMSSVFYSTLSKIKNESQTFNIMYYNAVRISNILIALIFIFIFYYADFIITIIYGDKWSESVIYLKMLILASFFYLQEMFNRLIFKIYDKTEIILQLEIFKKLIQSLTIFYGLYTLSIGNLLYGFIFTSFFSFNLNYYFARKVQKNFSLKEFLNIFKIIIVSILSIFLCNFIENKYFYELGFYGKLIFIPFLILFYFSFLVCFKVLDIENDFKKIFKILKGN